MKPGTTESWRRVRRFPWVFRRPKCPCVKPPCEKSVNRAHRVIVSGPPMTLFPRQLVLEPESKIGMDFRDCFEVSLDQLSHDTVREIVTKDFDVNQPDSFGTFILSAACKSLQVENVKLLLSLGADPNCFDDCDGSPLLCVTEVLHWNPAAACEIAHALLKSGADVEARYKGRTAFLLACCRGNLDFLKVLVAHGANPLATEDDHDRPSALYLAELAGAPAEMISYIREFRLR